MTVPGRPATLAVVPFRTGTPAPRSWAATVFAESLAARLARIPGLEPHVSTGGAGSSDFVLRGEVSAKDGRLVVATRLIDQSNGETVWTATFWRTDAPNPNLAGELAADVAEALYGHLARRAVTATEGKP
jgi:TolB-like protein